MKKYEKIYKELSKQFSDEEIVERYVIPEDISEAEKESLELEFKKLRLKSLKTRSEEQRILGELMRMKLLMKDYLVKSYYDEDFSFSNQLEQYIKILDRSKKDFANEIGLHPTKLSRLLNDRENPNIELMYRLEKHCGNVIPAIYWWKLHSKKLENVIKTDEKKRKNEGRKVKNSLKFRA